MKLIAVLLILRTFSFCAFERTPSGARQAGLGGGGAALASEPWCMLLNPAGAAAAAGSALSFTVVPALYGLGELSSASALALVEARPLALGLALDRFGAPGYREITATAVLARSFAAFEAGIAVGYQHLAISGYGSAGAFGLSAGLRGSVTAQLTLAAAARNLNAPRLGRSGERLPQEFRAALAYAPAPRLLLTADYAKQTGFDAGPSLGCEYRPIDEIAVRLGYAGVPDVLSGGLGIRAANLTIDYAAGYHAELGLTHTATLTFAWNR